MFSAYLAGIETTRRMAGDGPGAKFSAYLAGIETAYRPSLVPLARRFSAYLAGIETRGSTPRRRLGAPGFQPT